MAAAVVIQKKTSTPSNMIYHNLSFAKKIDRPFFYTNFVSTIDGKVMVTKNPQGYWPIGSLIDHNLLIELRAHSDLLIHGKNTATSFKTVNSLSSNKFKSFRKKLGKDQCLPYLVVSNHPDNTLATFLDGSDQLKVILVTSKAAKLGLSLPPQIEVWHIGESEVDLIKLAQTLKRKGFKNVLLEGGPTLLGEFLRDKLMDEIFLTLAPKIFGNEPGSTLTMVEGQLFPPDQVVNLKLLSVKENGDELFLRYKVQNTPS